MIRSVMLSSNNEKKFEMPDCDTFRAGCQAYAEHERRGPIYKVASFFVKHFWGKAYDVAEGLGVLLLIWNQAFYEYGGLDFQRLGDWIKRRESKLNSFRSRNIETFCGDDEKTVKEMFKELLEVLKSKKGFRSPVSVAKALHLLAPNFFPLWDNKIADSYGCMWEMGSPESASSYYIRFCKIVKEIMPTIKTYVDEKEETSLLKCLDEYNYARYTKGWI